MKLGDKVGIEPKPQRQPLRRRAVAQHVADAVEKLLDVEPIRFVGCRAGLDTGDVEDVLDHVQEPVPGSVNGPRHVALLRLQRGSSQQFRHPENGVQRRAQLVAHGREKTRLRLAGCLGAMPRVVEVAEQPEAVAGYQDQAEDQPDAESAFGLPDRVVKNQWREQRHRDQR